MSELEAEVKRVAEFGAKRTHGTSLVQGTHDDVVFYSEAPQMASLIAKLWAERGQLLKDVGEWQNRCGAHSVARDQLIEAEIQPREAIIQKQRELMRQAREAGKEAEQLIKRVLENKEWGAIEEIYCEFVDSLDALDAALNHE